MHNWEHYSRLSAYLLTATLIASCGGGGDSGLSVNGQSVATIQATNVLMGLGTTSSFKVRVLDGQTPIMGQTVNAQITVGADAATLTKSSVITDKDGYAEFIIKSAGSVAKGALSLSYVDATGNKALKTVDFEIKDGANTASTFALQAVSSTEALIQTTGITQKEIAVTLKDASGAAVVGATVNFSLPTANRGRLINTTAITDSNGKAIATIDGLNQTTGENMLIASYTDAIGSKASTAINFKIINKFDVLLEASVTELKTGNASTVLTARVTNASQALVKNAKVAFKVLNKEPIGALRNENGECLQNITDTAIFKDTLIDKSKVGALVVTDTLTGDNGLATTTFNVKDNNNSKRRVLVTVSDEFSAQAVDCLDLTLSGTTLKLDPAIINTTAVDSQKLTATVKNALGEGISGVDIQFKSGETVLKTDKTSSEGTLSLNQIFAASTTLTVGSSLFSLDTQEAKVNVSDVGFKVAYTNDKGDTIAAKDKNNVFEGKINTPITVTVSPATSKLLSTLQATVTNKGNGVFTISSSTPGLTRLDFVDVNTATGEQTVKGSSEFRFISTIPSKMTLQANVATLRPSEQAVIEAKLLDVNDNPVKGVLVEFNRTDPSNGTLSAAAATTDENGKASVTFTAGSLATAKDGVSISSNVKLSETSSIVASPVKLTVGGAALFITIATGKTISPLNETVYAMPLSIAVADAVGQPARDSQVSIQVVPKRYLKGVYYYNTAAELWVTAAVDPSFVASAITDSADVVDTLSPIACAKEDVNNNGILDVGEDKNGDANLTPANPVTVSGRLVTDENGRVSFNIQYGKSFANWLEVELIASTSVSGSEYKSTRTFVLPVLAADVSDKASSPPGGSISPYGNDNPIIYVLKRNSANNYVTQEVRTSTGALSLPLSTSASSTTTNLTIIDPCGNNTDKANRYYYKLD